MGVATNVWNGYGHCGRSGSSPACCSTCQLPSRALTVVLGKLHISVMTSMTRHLQCTASDVCAQVCDSQELHWDNGSSKHCCTT